MIDDNAGGLVTGCLLTRNCIKYDYCFEAALTSLTAFCDQVIVMDCCSDDGTDRVLMEYENQYCRIITGQKWEVANDRSRLAVLSNIIRKQVETPWYFHLQADEVVHENSFTAIRCGMINNLSTHYWVRRLNFWRDKSHYISFGAENKPCGDQIIRMAHQDRPITGDAESIEPNPRCENDMKYLDKIRIFHYGMIRDPYKMVDKCIDMQGWFWGPGGQVDANVLASKAKGEGFNFDAYNNNQITELDGTHPVFALKWLEQRKGK